MPKVTVDEFKIRALTIEEIAAVERATASDEGEGPDELDEYLDELGL